MIFKEKSKSISKAIGVILLIILVVFVIDTAVIALKTDENIVLDNYISKTFVSKDLSNQIKIISKDKVLITIQKKATYYSVIESEQNVLLIKDTEKDFAIKFLDENTIFCEKTKQILYLKE